MRKLTINAKESFEFKDLWSDISYNEFMHLVEIIAAKDKSFIDSFCNKYIPVEFDFDKEITDANKYIQDVIDLVRPFTNFTDFERLSTQDLFLLFNTIEKFYASIMVQAYIDFKPTESITAVLLNGSFKFLNKPIDILGSHFELAKVSAKSMTEMHDLTYYFDTKTAPMFAELQKLTQERFEALPMLAAVMLTKKYDQEKVMELAEKLKSANMQDLISVFFYADKLYWKHRPVIEPCTMELQPAE